MSRPLRIDYEGAWYHVMNRGAGKCTIFSNRAHYELFLKLLNEIHNRYRIEIHAYCLMRNHYHLLVHTPLANLSRGMRHLNGVYTQRYNSLMRTDGPLFRGRFKSIVVDAEDYLLSLSRYIHLNPVVAGIVKDAGKYHWSSYGAYLNKKLSPYWLSTNVVLEQFGSRKQRQKYQLFIEEGIDKELDTFFKKLKRIPILGSEAFVKTVTQKYLKDKTKEIPEQNRLYKLRLPSIKDIMQAVAKYYHIDISALKVTKLKSSNKPRAIAIYLAFKLSGQSLQAIADQFTNISYSGVAQSYKRIKEKIEKDPIIAKEIVFLEKEFQSEGN